MSRAELQELQLARLQATLRHAYEHVELYRRKFDDAGVTPADCRSLADLARFPFTTKADLRDTYPFGMFAVPMDRVRRLHASSGTTGRPVVVGYTDGDLSMWADVVARSIRAAGGRPGHKVHISYGYGLFTGGLGAHYGAERAGCLVIPASGGMTARQVQLIQDFEPEIIMVTPPTCSPCSTSSSARGSTRARPRCGSASSAPSPGPRRCAGRSRSGWTSTPWTSTACPR